MPAEGDMAHDSHTTDDDLTVIVVTGAGPITRDVIADLDVGSCHVIAADSGLDHARRAGLDPNLLVGDLDSVSARGRRWAERNCVIDPYPADKDATDTRLALRRAAELVPDRIVLVTGIGDRLDHTLGALGALRDPALIDVPYLEVRWGRQRIRVLRGPDRTTIHAPEGTTLSLVPLTDDCTGVHLTGTQWPLDGVTIPALSDLGVSNIVTGAVDVSLSTGTLCIFTEVPT